MSNLTKVQFQQEQASFNIRIENIHPNARQGWLEGQKPSTVFITGLFILLDYFEQTEMIDHLIYKQIRAVLEKTYLKSDSDYYDTAYLTEFGCHFYEDCLDDLYEFASVLQWGNYDYWEQKFSGKLKDNQAEVYPFVLIQIHLKAELVAGQTEMINDTYESTLDTNLINWV